MSLSSQSVFGLIAIAGVVVNDSILLMEFMQNARITGMSHPRAARQASRDRFRAVLLTSATTIAGLVPHHVRDQPAGPDADPGGRRIVFGLGASTVLVLIVVPAAFVMLHDFGLAPRPARPPASHGE